MTGKFGSASKGSYNSKHDSDDDELGLDNILNEFEAKKGIESSKLPPKRAKTAAPRP